MRIYTSLFFSFVFHFVSFGALANQPEAKAVDCSSKTCFPTITKIGDLEVPLLGSKLFKYYIWTAYSIALYGPAEARSIEKISQDIPKKLVLEYRRDFSAQDFIDAADELLKNNPEIDYKKLSPQLAEMNKLYQPIKEGDSYALEYEPGKGTTLFMNGKPLGTVVGEEFGRHYLGIWLSKYPISEDLRDKLLGTAS